MSVLVAKKERQSKACLDKEEYRGNNYENGTDHDGLFKYVEYGE